MVLKKRNNLRILFQLFVLLNSPSSVVAFFMNFIVLMNLCLKNSIITHLHVSSPSRADIHSYITVLFKNQCPTMMCRIAVKCHGKSETLHMILQTVEAHCLGIVIL